MLYVIVTEPELIPVTTPVELTVASDVLEDVHAPPDVVSTRVVLEPAQSADEPDIGLGLITPTVGGRES